MLRFLTLDVTYHELSGYWGGLNETAAWHALWWARFHGCQDVLDMVEPAETRSEDNQNR